MGYLRQVVWWRGAGCSALLPAAVVSTSTDLIRHMTAAGDKQPRERAAGGQQQSVKKREVPTYYVLPSTTAHEPTYLPTYLLT